MKKQDLTLYVLAGAILISAGLLTWTTAQSKEHSDPAAVYRLEKLNEVSDMVLDRKIVPDSYLCYLEEDLAASVAEYNTATSGLFSDYRSFAADVLDSILMEQPENSRGWYGQVLETPEMRLEWEERLAHAALYQNSWELLRADPSLVGHHLMQEAGGSGSLFASALHEDWYMDEDLAARVKEYFVQVEQLCGQLDQTRAGFEI